MTVFVTLYLSFWTQVELWSSQLFWSGASHTYELETKCTKISGNSDAKRSRKWKTTDSSKRRNAKQGKERRYTKKKQLNMPGILS